MNDKIYAILFIAIGLTGAYFVSKPMRTPHVQPVVGTPLSSQSRSMNSSSQISQSSDVYAEGSIQLDSSLQEVAEKSAAIFLIIRPPEGRVPIAVQKISSPTFPLSFRLTADDNMVGEEFYRGDLVFVARLDQDGVVGPLTPEDREFTYAMKATDSRQLEITLR